METAVKPMVTVAGLAALTTLSESTVRLWLRTTDIPHIRAGSRIIFETASVLDWLRKTERKSRPRKKPRRAATVERKPRRRTNSRVKG